MQSSFITTSTATVGGLTKAFVIGFAQPATITLPQLTEVAIYATVSATIGYGIKMFFDWIKYKISQRKLKRTMKKADDIIRQAIENNNEELPFQK